MDLAREEKLVFLLLTRPSTTFSMEKPILFGMGR
jgi:hypothetical protein